MKEKNNPCKRIPKDYGIKGPRAIEHAAAVILCILGCMLLIGIAALFQ